MSSSSSDYEEPLTEDEIKRLKAMRVVEIAQERVLKNQIERNNRVIPISKITKEKPMILEGEDKVLKNIEKEKKKKNNNMMLWFLLMLVIVFVLYFMFEKKKIPFFARKKFNLKF